MSDEHLQTPTESGAAPAFDGELPRHTETRESRRSRHASPRTLPRSRVSARTALLAFLGVIIFLVVVIAADVALSWDRVHPGVRLSGVPVGSLTESSARARLAEAFNEASQTPVVVASGGANWKVHAGTIGASPDITASVNAAMAVGRTQGAWRMIADRFSAVFGGVEVTATISTDSEKIAALLDKIEGAIGVPSRDASVTIEGGTAVLHKSEAGDALDRAATTQAILDAFLSRTHKATAVIVRAPVRVSDADANQAYLDVQKLLAGSVVVIYKDQSLTVPRATVAKWVRFERRPISGPSGPSTPGASAAGTRTATSAVEAGTMTLVASFDATRVGDAIKSMTDGLRVKARNASFAVVGGKVTIKPSKDGRGPDLASLAEDLAKACISGTSRSAELRLVTVHPSLTTESARDMGISDRISSYTTYYDASAAPRVSNIHLLADAFDTKLVPPGGTFSFNAAAGQRTAAKGYQEAPAIVNGKLVPQLGGGVCQVGTTFFNAVFFAGLPVVERHNHSFYVSHYPTGRDATVSWGGPDFKFKNNTDGWILIRTSYTSSSLTISLYGSDPGYDVEFKTSKFLDVVPFKVSERKDPKLKLGARIVEEAGINGGRVVVTRTVYKGGEVVRVDTFTSRYTPKSQVVRVGTKVPSTPTTTTPTP